MIFRGSRGLNQSCRLFGPPQQTDCAPRRACPRDRGGHEGHQEKRGRAVCTAYPTASVSRQDAKIAKSLFVRSSPLSNLVSGCHVCACVDVPDSVAQTCLRKRKHGTQTRHSAEQNYHLSWSQYYYSNHLKTGSWRSRTSGLGATDKLVYPCSIRELAHPQNTDKQVCPCHPTHQIKVEGVLPLTPIPCSPMR